MFVSLLMWLVEKNTDFLWIPDQNCRALVASQKLEKKYISGDLLHSTSIKMLLSIV